ncbi:uncharacterized protein LOC108664893 [Hyalella azteca]|uniref:Uncharacterized protein LOC108664893 n=1 Tax=Hyalella azteca TaxID=294128 RepID=A0A8B7MZT8_HYAAZ|nr:uncharacterized protein LOC108664893 [Hyalella azteca]
MPDTSAKILQIMNLPDATHWRLPNALPHAVPSGCKVTKPEPLIKKITDEELQQWQLQFKGTDDSAAKCQVKKNSAVVLPAIVNVDIESLKKMIDEQGDKVRALKAGGASKADISADVATLLQLKNQLAQAQGAPAVPPAKDKKQKKARIDYICRKVGV